MAIEEVHSIFGDTAWRFTCDKPHVDGQQWASKALDTRELAELAERAHDAELHAPPAQAR